MYITMDKGKRGCSMVKEGRRSTFIHGIAICDRTYAIATIIKPAITPLTPTFCPPEH